MNWRKWLFVLVVLPVSRLPERMRYLLADGIAWVLRSVVKYRRQVIDANIETVFPRYSQEKREEIRNAFYKNFADVALEQTWLFTASREALAKSVTFENPEEFERHIAANKHIMIAAAHHNNYEMAATSLPLFFDIPIAGVYAPLANKFFDERVRATRQKFGLYMWPRGTTPQRASEWAEQYDCFSLGFVCDQSPHAGNKKYWLDFMGKRTAVAKGLESYALRYDAAVVFINVERVRRGRYRLRVHTLSEDARAEPQGAMLLKAYAHIEQTIKEDPVGWLWSHRRWKLDFEKHRIEEDIVL